jgi:hypothetical protein
VWRVSLFLFFLLLARAQANYFPWNQAPVTLTVSTATFTPDCSASFLSTRFLVTLTANNQILGNPSNCPVGLPIEVTVSTSTGFTGFSTAANYKFSGAIAPTWSSASSKTDVISCNHPSTSVFGCSANVDVR